MTQKIPSCSSTKLFRLTHAYLVMVVSHCTIVQCHVYTIWDTSGMVISHTKLDIALNLIVYNTILIDVIYNYYDNYECCIWHTWGADRYIQWHSWGPALVHLRLSRVEEDRVLATPLAQRQQMGGAQGVAAPPTTVIELLVLCWYWTEEVAWSDEVERVAHIKQMMT